MDDTARGARSIQQLEHRVFRFDRFTLDLTRGSLQLGEQDIYLRPKAFDVLCYLVESAGRLVPSQSFTRRFGPTLSCPMTRLCSAFENFARSSATMNTV